MTPALPGGSKTRVKGPLGHARGGLVRPSSLLPFPSPPLDLAPPPLLWSPFQSKFPVDMLSWVIENKLDVGPGGRGCCGLAGKGPAHTLTSFRSWEHMTFTEKMLQGLLLMVEVPVLHDFFKLLQHFLTLVKWKGQKSTCSAGLWEPSSSLFTTCLPTPPWRGR